MGDVIQEFEKMICFGLQKSKSGTELENILLGEYTKCIMTYFAGRHLYNGGDDRLKSGISNPARCLFYLNHSNHHLRFWKIRSALEETENLNEKDKKQMMICLNNIQRYFG